ncbi:hypothetical protein WDU94_014110 [Cyamophila willieti]
MLSNLVKSHNQHLPSVLEDMGTNAEQLTKDVASLREWYSYQTHLPQSIGDSVLASFIVGSKNSMEIAKMKLDMFYSLRRGVPDIYNHCDPTSNQLVKSYKTVYTITLPTLTSDGSSVSILKLRNPDPAMYNPLDPVKRLNMIYELMLHQTTLTSKSYLIYDYEQVTNAHVTQLNPLVVKTHLDTLKFLPIRLKGVIAINCPKYAERTYNLMRNFMSKKLQDRIFIYAEGASVLAKHISVNVLPKDYGGQGAYTLDELNDYWQDVLIDNREWFMNENEHNSNESKRPADSKYKADEDTYGVEGSFKKLEID